MNKIIPIFVPHRGCPHDCAFCNQKKITGKGDVIVNGEYVERQIKEYLGSRDKYSDLAFFGGSFTAIDLDFQIELLEKAFYYKNKGYFENIRVSTRPDAIDDERLQVLKKYGVNIVELGIQSLDEEVLKKANRGHSAKDSENASRMIRDYGFVLGHQVMPGLPGSSYESDVETCRKSIEMKPDIARIYPTLIIKETDLENMYKENKYKPLSVEEAVEISSYIYSLYTVNNVKVIRIGLQNTDTIKEGGDVVAGPFHPSFRQLVEENLYCSVIVRKLRQLNVKEDIEIVCCKKLMSYVVGNKKKNIAAVKKETGIKRVFIKEKSDCDAIDINSGGKLLMAVEKDSICKEYIK